MSMSRIHSLSDITFALRHNSALSHQAAKQVASYLYHNSRLIRFLNLPNLFSRWNLIEYTPMQLIQQLSFPYSTAIEPDGSVAPYILLSISSRYGVVHTIHHPNSVPTYVVTPRIS